MAQDGVVEVRAAEVVDSDGLADQAERPVDLLAQDDGVERAAAEVVHREGLAGLERPRRLVVARGGFGFGDEFDVADSDRGAALTGSVSSRWPPHAVGCVRETASGRWPSRSVDELDDGGDGERVQLFGRQRSSADDERDLVADAALELADQPLGLSDAAPLGDIAEGQVAILGDEDHGGDAVALAAQREGRSDDAAVRRDSRRGCGDPARPHIDSQKI